ncbi:MAG: acyl-CoA dehydrogenase family protein, partial [Enterobacteriaceae bacterium]
MIRDQETMNILLNTVTRFVNNRLVPCEKIVADTDEIPAEIIAEMKSLGLFGLTIPENYGGLGLTMEEEVLVIFELGKTSPAFRSIIGTNNGIGSQGLIIDGTEEQKKCYLPRLASGELIASFALT